jgi:Na+-translocating ferredoxin:NAD+ oxidoreductase RnfD subunit
LLYFNKRLTIAALTVVLALGSKYLFRVQANGRLQHFMNPSNFGISTVLATYHWVGVLPWAFTVGLHGAWDWIIPVIIVMLGTRLNLLFTGRLPLVAAWLVTFFIQAGIRSWRMDAPFVGQIVPLSGVAMILFTLYMITDPQTSPSKLRSQIIFGSSIGIAYSILLDLHVQYTIFFAVTAVCATRGIILWVVGKRQLAAEQPKVMAAAAGAMAERAPATVAQ